MDVRALLGRILERPRIVTARRAFDAYGAAAGGLLANGLAFTTLFAAIPTTLLVLGVTGWAAAGHEAIRRRVTDALVAAFPPLADVVRSAVEAITEGAAVTSVVGAIGLVWTVSQLFSAFDVAFARIYAGERERGAVWRTVRGILVVAVLAAGLVAVVAALVLLATFEAGDPALDPAAGDVIGALASPIVMTGVAGLVVIAAYRLLPPRPPSWRALAVPAIVVAVVLAILGQVFGFTAPRLVGVAELAGPLASGFVALAWLSFSFQALLLGGAWVRVRDERAGSAPLEGPAAPAEAGRRGE